MGGWQKGFLRYSSANLKEKVFRLSTAHQECVLLLLVYVFVFLTLLYARLAHSPGATLINTIAIFATVTTTTGGAHLLIRRKGPVIDPFLLPSITCLIGLGLIMLERLAPNFLAKQLLWCISGMIGLVVAIRCPRNLRWLRRYRYLWLLLGLFLLGLTFLFGVNRSAGVHDCGLFWVACTFSPPNFSKWHLSYSWRVYLAEKQELIRLTHSRVGNWTLPPLAYLTPLLLVWG